MRTKLSWTLVCTATAAIGAGCGDNKGGEVDGPEGVFDGRPADGNIDSAPDQILGQMSFLEAKVFQDIGGGTIAAVANGPSVRLAFIDPAATGAPAMEDMPGSPFGCKVWEYNIAQFGATVGGNLGTMAVTFADDTPVVPTCVFTGPPLGHTCPDVATANAGDNATITPAAMGAAAYADTDRMFTAARSVGRYLAVSGATDAPNNGAFPILQAPAMSTAVIYNPLAVAADPVGGMALEVFGIGPSPGLAAVDFMGDDDSATFMFTSTNPAAMPSFTSQATNAGDDFTMNQANLGILTNIPLDGSEFTIDCQNCGSALSSVLNVLTTDASVTGLPATTLPPPMTKAVLLRCTNTTGVTSVTVPAAYSAYLMGAGATRLQATFVRGSTAGIQGIPLGKMAIVLGHSAVGFTTP